MIATAVILSLLGFALIGAFFWANSFIVFNSTRYLATPPTILWSETNYVRMLPNMLKCLYDAGLSSPWPSHPTALAALFFRRRLRKILKHAFPNCSLLIQHHLGLWAFIQLHQDNLHDQLLRRQIERITHFLADSRDSSERERALAFLNQCKEKRKRFSRKGASPLIVLDNIHWLSRLKNLNVLLSEHGYSISQEFTTLAWWEAADDRDIVERFAGPLVTRSGRSAWIAGTTKPA